VTAIRYTALGPDGVPCRGTVEASEPAQALAVLTARGLHALRLEVVAEEPRRGPASRHDQALLFRSLASLTEAGVPLDRAVRSTAQAVPGVLGHDLPAVEAALREGLGLGRALGSLNGAVPAGVLRMLEAGERAGRLPGTLAEVAGHLEREAELATRLQGALAYPLVLLVTGVLSVGVIGLVILPRFTALLADLGQDPPRSTRLVLAGVEVLRTIAPYLPVACLCAGMAGMALVRHPRAAEWLGNLVLDAPVLGPVRHGLAAGRWLRAFSAALASGLPMLHALEAAAAAANDGALRARTATARQRVAEGDSITMALSHARVLPTVALQIVSIGDASGRLALMAGRAGELASADAERRLRRLIGLLEPLLVLAFGALVALVAAALLQAVYALRPTP
jgi:general secretion pathway protein F